MGGRQDLHVDLVLLDLIQPHFDIEKVLGHRPGLGPHAQDNSFPFFVPLDSHVALGRFESFQIFLGVKVAMEIDVHGLHPY